ncbi:MAG: hypothetical protein ABSF29_12650 [Tepidisphaeraceae bacterium]|jgi:hypothetical protein
MSLAASPSLFPGIGLRDWWNRRRRRKPRILDALGSDADAHLSANAAVTNCCCSGPCNASGSICAGNTPFLAVEISGVSGGTSINGGYCVPYAGMTDCYEYLVPAALYFSENLGPNGDVQISLGLNCGSTSGVFYGYTLLAALENGKTYCPADEIILPYTDGTGAGRPFLNDTSNHISFALDNGYATVYCPPGCSIFCQQTSIPNSINIAIEFIVTGATTDYNGTFSGSIPVTFNFNNFNYEFSGTIGVWNVVGTLNLTTLSAGCNWQIDELIINTGSHETIYEFIFDSAAPYQQGPTTPDPSGSYGPWLPANSSVTLGATCTINQYTGGEWVVIVSD